MFTRDWTRKEIRDAAEQLRTGTRPEEVAASLDRSQNALKQAVTRGGFPYGKLLREGVLARVRAILSAGGNWPEVAASEGVLRRMAVRLITQAMEKGDRRHLRRGIQGAEARKVYVLVRDQGLTQAARQLGKPITVVRRAAHRYRDAVLPDSPPLERRKAS